MDEQATLPRKRVNFRKDGEIDERGHGEGSVATRFRRGDGRPRPGRPKGARSERQELKEVMDMSVEVLVGGRKRHVTTRKAIFLRGREKALRGDQKAMEWLDRKFTQHEPPEVDLSQTERLLAEDEAILLADARARGLIGPAEENSQ